MSRRTPAGSARAGPPGARDVISLTMARSLTMNSAYGATPWLRMTLGESVPRTSPQLGDTDGHNEPARDAMQQSSPFRDNSVDGMDGVAVECDNKNGEECPRSKHVFTRADVERILHDALREQEPVEVSGPAGTVVL